MEIDIEEVKGIIIRTVRKEKGEMIIVKLRLEENK